MIIIDIKFTYSLSPLHVKLCMYPSEVDLLEQDKTVMKFVPLYDHICFSVLVVQFTLKFLMYP